MFPVTETQSSTRPQRLLNVLRRERILKADSRCFGEILQKNFKFACSQQLCEHLPLFIKGFIYHIIYLRESRRRKSKVAVGCDGRRLILKTLAMSVFHSQVSDLQVQQ